MIIHVIINVAASYNNDYMNTLYWLYFMTQPYFCSVVLFSCLSRPQLIKKHLMTPFRDKIREPLICPMTNKSGLTFFLSIKYLSVCLSWLQSNLRFQLSEALWIIIDFSNLNDNRLTSNTRDLWNYQFMRGYSTRYITVEHTHTVFIRGLISVWFSLFWERSCHVYKFKVF